MLEIRKARLDYALAFPIKTISVLGQKLIQESRMNRKDTAHIVLTRA